MNRVRILLADAHPDFSQLVENLLEPAHQVIGTVRDGQALLDVAAKYKPDIVITAIALPVLNGIDAAEELRKMNCKAKVVFLTVQADPDFIRTCLAAGAFGYIVKERVAVDLLPAVHEVLSGRLFISPYDTERSKTGG